MTRLIVPAFVMTCCAVAFAQTPDPTKQTPAKGMKPEGITVTGCVAESSPAGHFMLNNASMSHDAMKKEGTRGATGAAGASMTDKMSSYMLVGGDNLKAHVGHKVEVTGSLSMEKPKTERPSTPEGSMSAAELKVQSIKMVSATCP